MKSKYCVHLIRNIPNYWFFRWIVFWLNKRMKKSDSCYRLKIRYRKPKKGKHHCRGGGLKRKDGKVFSIYIYTPQTIERNLRVEREHEERRREIEYKEWRQ